MEIIAVIAEWDITNGLLKLGINVDGEKGFKTIPNIKTQEDAMKYVNLLFAGDWDEIEE
jgi:hypothetical protein